MCAFKRRALLKGALAAPFFHSGASRSQASPTLRRARPGDPSWPDLPAWESLRQALGGRLSTIVPPLSACASAPDGAACERLFKALKNPYYIGDTPGLTQTSGYFEAWTSTPGAYVVTAARAQDMATAVDFAREQSLRLVVRGGAHSYHGTSNSADSLVIWTRAMRGISMHDAFVPAGCAGRVAAQPAVTVEAGALWEHVYDAVTTKGGRYVQVGGCGTVGVAGLVQSGGFGSFSKRYGTAAASLLQARVVTADGRVRTVNACQDPELLWGLKGGGGGSLGVVTELTLRTHALPERFGVVMASVKATSAAAFRRLMEELLRFYADSLMNPHWGETVNLRPDNVLKIEMLFQGLDRDDASRVWQPFLDWVGRAGSDYVMASAPRILDLPARHFWDPPFIMAHAPDVLLADDRPGAPAGNVFWADNLKEAGQYLYGYESTWLPASLLTDARRAMLADALFAASRQWNVGLSFNKGLAGAPPEARAAAADTAMNPVVLDAFALAIIAGEGPPAFAGVAGHEPDLTLARRYASRIRTATETLRQVVPDAGSYVSESSFFEPDWQHAHWGDHYERLARVKHAYDPDGLFFVHHGVGSQSWSSDGFTRIA
jgi:FAD/FMN-containing dehydrogenase